MIDILTMAARDHFQAAIFLGCIDQGEPNINHECVGRIPFEVSKVLMPRDDRSILVRQFRPDVELGMGEYFGPDQRLDDVEQTGMGHESKHRGRLQFPTNPCMQNGILIVSGFPVRSRRDDPGETCLKGFAREGLGDEARSESLTCVPFDGRRELGDQGIEIGFRKRLVDDEIAIREEGSVQFASPGMK